MKYNLQIWKLYHTIYTRSQLIMLGQYSMGIELYILQKIPKQRAWQVLTAKKSRVGSLDEIINASMKWKKMEIWAEYKCSWISIVQVIFVLSWFLPGAVTAIVALLHLLQQNNSIEIIYISLSLLTSLLLCLYLSPLWEEIPEFSYLFKSSREISHRVAGLCSFRVKVNFH